MERQQSTQLHCYVEENATRRMGRTNAEDVNNRGLGFRGGKVWLPKYADIEVALRRRQMAPDVTATRVRMFESRVVPISYKFDRTECGQLPLSEAKTRRI